MSDDAELLREYAEKGSEAAFAALVARRVDLVYSVALRQCGGDAHRAGDVTQRVFTDLARKAGALSRRPVLSGWLYRSAQFAAADLVRSDRRRRAREAEAQTMHDISHEPVRDSDWEKLRPVLDDVMGELAEADRDAVMLRFFEGRAFREIGAALRLTEDAARMRVERALDKLHAALKRRGVTSTTAALGVALANQAGVAAPAGMAAAVTGVALAGATAGTGFMSMTTLQIGLVGALVVAGAAGWMTQAKANADLRTEMAALQQGRQEVARLETENRGLARAALDLEMLRVDPAEMAHLREEVRVAQQRARTAPPVRPVWTKTFPAPLPLSDPDTQVTVRLPDADAHTALSVLEVFTGQKIVRDPSLGRTVGLIDYRPVGRITKGQAVEAVRAALRDRCGIELELTPDGNIVAKPVAGR